MNYERPYESRRDDAASADTKEKNRRARVWTYEQGFLNGADWARVETVKEICHWLKHSEETTPKQLARAIEDKFTQIENKLTTYFEGTWRNVD